MSGSPAWVLQQAVYDRLSGDASLTTTLGAGVYDHAPQHAAYPYVVIDEVTEVPSDTMQTTGRDVVVTIHTWSQYRGAKQVKQIHDRLSALLDRWSPTLTGWGATHMRFEFSDTMRDPDGITRHGIARFRVYATQG